MRLLFVNPNLRPGSEVRYLPVGLAYVMTAVQNAGYDLDLLDIGLGDETDDEVEAYLARGHWDVVLTGSIVTHYKWMKWLTFAIRRHQPHAKIIVGNSVAGSVPELFLEHSAADIVVVGEGESTTLDTLEALGRDDDLARVPGIVFRAETRCIHNPRRSAAPIDSIAMPNWKLFDVKRYFTITDSPSAFGVRQDGQNWRTMPVATARGCVFSCTFCHIVYKHDPYRHRSTQSVLSEVDACITEYGANYINFWDDLTFYKLSQAEKIIDGLLDSGHRFSWSGAVRTDLFGNPRVPYSKRLAVARKFKESGCSALGFSLESGNTEILKMMNKHVEVDFFEEQVAILREVGITCNTSVVFGYPIETRESIRQTFELCERNRVYPSVGYLLPLPDTDMYRYALKHGYIDDEDAFLDSITERQDICLNMTQLTDEEILFAIEDGLSRLNEMLGLGLDRSHLVRTGGYRKHTKVDGANAPAVPLRNRGDVSFSYSQAVFDMNHNS